MNEEEVKSVIDFYNIIDELRPQAELFVRAVVDRSLSTGNRISSYQISQSWNNWKKERVSEK